MSTFVQEVECLFTTGMNFVSAAIWLESPDKKQHVLLLGEHHVASSCKGKQLYKTDICTPDLVLMVNKWSEKSEILLEWPSPPYFNPDNQEPVSYVDLLAVNLFKNDRVHLCELRPFFYPSKNVVSEWDLIAEQSPEHIRAMIESIMDTCFVPLRGPHSSLTLYLTHSKEITEKKLSESRKEIFRKCWGDIIDRVEAAQSIYNNIEDQEDPPTYKQWLEIFDAHKFVGQEFSDLLGVIPWIIQEKANTSCVFWGGHRHVDYISNLLTSKFGYRILLQHKSADETNCLLPLRPIDPSLIMGYKSPADQINNGAADSNL